MSRCNPEDPFIEFAAVLMAIGMLAIVLVVLGIIWFLIAAVVAAIRYWLWYRQAAASFEDIARDMGLNYNPDDVIRAVHGAGIHLPDDGYKSVGAWAAGSLFGVTEEESA